MASRSGIAADADDASIVGSAVALGLRPRPFRAAAPSLPPPPPPLFSAAPFSPRPAREIDDDPLRLEAAALAAPFLSCFFVALREGLGTALMSA